MAKKRYHQSMMDRMHESAGEREHDMMDRAMYRHKGVMGPEYYAGVDPRRRQEMRDAGMIQEDHKAVANLPQNVIMRPYGDAGGYLPEDLDDTISGVNRQMDLDGKKRMEHFYPKKV